MKIFAFRWTVNILAAMNSSRSLVVGWLVRRLVGPQTKKSNSDQTKKKYDSTQLNSTKIVKEEKNSKWDIT